VVTYNTFLFESDADTPGFFPPPPPHMSIFFLSSFLPFFFSACHAAGTTISVEDGKYVFEYDENGTQITIVETNTIIYMNSDGEVTSIDSEATGRRTLEEAVPARKLEEACDVVTCDTQLLDSCATLDTLCGPPVQAPLTEAVCLSVPIMCNPAALDAACTQECAAGECNMVCLHVSQRRPVKELILGMPHTVEMRVLP